MTGLIWLLKLLFCGVSARSATHHLYRHDPDAAASARKVTQYLGYPTFQCSAKAFPPRTWTDPLEHVEDSEQLFGTVYAQHQIWEHQNPALCAEASFLVHRVAERGHGIGSMLHMVNAALGLALELGRVYILYPERGVGWHDEAWCKGADDVIDCYFEPLSSCTIRDALEDYKAEVAGDLPQYNTSQNQKSVRALALMQPNGGYSHFQFKAPSRFHLLLGLSGIPQDKWYYWWRAQGIAYVVRPNSRTLQELRVRRAGLLVDNTPARLGYQRLPAGCLSVHIRHGDKWTENNLISTEDFVQSALELSTTVNGLRRIVFLSTEDPQAVRTFSSLNEAQPPWQVIWTDVDREAFEGGLTNVTVSPEAYAHRIGVSEEFLNGLLNLQLALECGAFLGQLTSNWNRLIDELRSTVRCKANSLYYDAEQGWEIKSLPWRKYV